MTMKNNIIAKSGKSRKASLAESPKLSKWAKWWQANPKGLDIEILDWRAVMR